ncbi:helix-turn-helix domain-containing protein [Kitasatospora sp. NBC_00240]|uniref:helix-turn-helix domain-containing protein n=1 Tax=Kitasatospora sp. NBC_00240 TaxID=2903567 RepID=UPI0022528934|nr:helix-turn-helix transcriptional regulator [Kitasatospora sp. NBC_00240]MCX5212582.1 helix-turn-helix domain-containing protein [Kitasatospora sp. NBC_00240]
MTPPTVRRRQLGSQLRRLREALDLTLEDVEKRTGLTAAKLSRVELAKSAAKPADVELLARVYGCTDQLCAALVAIAKDGGKRGWWLNYLEDMAPWLADQISLESSAKTFRTYEVQLVPGLFQTADYARAIITRLGLGIAPSDIEARVRVRRERQSVLTQPQPLEVSAVIHEAALASRVGGDRTMRGQLEKLLELASLPNVTIQVMPSATGAHQGMTGPFTILGFRESDLDVVLVEGMLTSEWLEEPDRVSVYDRAFREITADAWPLERSIEFIAAQKDILT